MIVDVVFATPLSLLPYAARTSHSSVMDCDSMGDELGPNDRKLVEKILRDGHESVLEHIVYSFKIQGVSRAVLQEWSRHRFISQTVKSTRFTLGKFVKDFNPHLEDFADIMAEVSKYCVVPPALDDLEDVVRSLYLMLTDISDYKLPPDHLKYLLPEAFKTDIFATINARELMHILRLRTAPDALWEFRDLAFKLYEGVLEVHSVLWEGFLDDD